MLPTAHPPRWHRAVMILCWIIFMLLAFIGILVACASPPKNTPPPPPDPTFTTPEDTPLEITLTGHDKENDTISYTISYTIVTEPQRGSLTGDAPTLTYTPENDNAGQDSFTCIANDGQSNSAEATVTITPVHDAPVADDQTLTIPEDTPFDITLIGHDANGKAIRIRPPVSRETGWGRSSPEPPRRSVGARAPIHVAMRARTTHPACYVRNLQR